MKKIVCFAVLFLGVSAGYAEEAVHPLNWREKYDQAQLALDVQRAKVGECLQRLSDKTEDVASVKVALANSDRDRLRCDGKLLSTSESNDKYRQDNAELRQKQTLLELSLMRYSWAVGVEAIGMVGLAIMMIVLLLKRPKKNSDA